MAFGHLEFASLLFLWGVNCFLSVNGMLFELLEVLDREEFGEAKAASEYDESAIHSASDLGLLVAIFELVCLFSFFEHLYD